MILPGGISGVVENRVGTGGPVTREGTLIRQPLSIEFVNFDANGHEGSMEVGNWREGRRMEGAWQMGVLRMCLRRCNQEDGNKRCVALCQRSLNEGFLQCILDEGRGVSKESGWSSIHQIDEACQEQNCRPSLLGFGTLLTALTPHATSGFDYGGRAPAT